MVFRGREETIGRGDRRVGRQVGECWAGREGRGSRMTSDREAYNCALARRSPTINDFEEVSSLSRLFPRGESWWFHHSVSLARLNVPTSRTRTAPPERSSDENYVISPRSTIRTSRALSTRHSKRFPSCSTGSGRVNRLSERVLRRVLHRDCL